MFKICAKPISATKLNPAYATSIELIPVSMDSAAPTSTIVPTLFFNYF